MRMLLTGGNGTFGTVFCDKLLKDHNHNLFAPSRYVMDITSYKQVSHYVGYHSNEVDIIIHAAAFIGLNPCQEQKEKAYNTNVVGTAIINRVAEHHNLPLIYISTDYVFDGTKKGGLYNEGDIPNPLSYYAKTKWAGECITTSYCRKIIRTSFCKNYWPHEKAFTDKYSSFDTVDKIVDLVIKCIKKNSKWKGILHVGTERKSFYELAKKLKPDVQELSYRYASVEIPEDTSFDLTKMNGVLSEH